MKSQQMMFSMVKEVAKSLRESKVHVKLFNTLYEQILHQFQDNNFIFNIVSFVVKYFKF